VKKEGNKKSNTLISKQSTSEFDAQIHLN